MILTDTKKTVKPIALDMSERFHILSLSLLINAIHFFRLMTPQGFQSIPSSQLKVGDIIQIEGGQRIPADCILLHSR